MSTLRDLIVSIDFEDLGIKDLKRLDSAIDEVKDSLEDVGKETDDVTNAFRLLDKKGNNVLDNLARKSTNFSVRMGGVVTALSGATASAAPLLATVGALGATFASAGIGAVGFGAVAVGALSQVFEASEEVQKLEEQIASADSVKERLKLQHELNHLYDDMSEGQRGALKELESFKGFWSGFVKEFETPVFNIFSSGLEFTQNLLNGFKPAITAVSSVLDHFMNTLNSGFDNGQFTSFFEWINKTSGRGFEALLDTVTNTMGGVFNLLQAFDPITKSVEDGLVGMTQRFKEWSSGLGETDGFKDFIEYAKTNGPVLLSTLGNLADIIKDVVTAIAPMGTTVISAVDKVTSAISSFDHWRDTLIGVGVAVGSFTVMMKGLSIITTVVGFIKTWRTVTLSAAVAQLGLNAAMLASPVTWVVAGIAGLITAGVLLYRNWDTVKEKATQLWSWLKEKFGAIKEAVLTDLQPILDFFNRLTRGWDNFKNKVANFKMPKIGIPKWMGGEGLIQVQGSHANGLESVPNDNYLANLHKSEAVLTATQANLLRSQGILSSNGDRPQINLGSQQPNQPASKNFSPTYNITIEGGNGNSNDIAEKVKEVVRKENDKFWYQMNLKSI